MRRSSGSGSACTKSVKLLVLAPAVVAVGLLLMHIVHPEARIERRILLELPGELDGEFLQPISPDQPFAGAHSTMGGAATQLAEKEVTELPGGEVTFSAQQHRAIRQRKQHGLPSKTHLTLPAIASQGGLLGLEAWQGQEGPVQRKAGPTAARPSHTPSAVTAAAAQFLRYVPSQWEREWLAAAPILQANPDLICKTMIQESARTKTWVDAMKAQAAMQAAPAGQALPLDPSVFSRFIYQDPISGEEYGVWIEPLVGHFRHPYNPEPCTPPGMPPLPIQDRSYIMLHGLTQHQFNRVYPGKKYLFDLGTADFESSLGWFIQSYSSWGVTFDEIWAWEVENMPPTEYWSHVPASMKPHLHFYNIPVTVDPGSADNPINIIRSIYRPGDFVSIKLDIDNTPLELSLIEQIRRDPATINSIAEMNFEMHYDHKDMWLCFGHPNATWSDVANLFNELRSSGLRLHYWP